MAAANPDDEDLAELSPQLDDWEAIKEDGYDLLKTYAAEKLGGRGWGEGTTTIRILDGNDGYPEDDVVNPKIFIGRYFSYLRSGNYSYFVESLDDLLSFKSSNESKNIEEKIEKYLGLDIASHPIQIMTNC